MSRTPGVIVPSEYSSEEDLLKDLKRRSESSGFTPFKEWVKTTNLTEENPSLEELVHFGVLGMKWGHRKSNLSGVSEKTNREANKDAKEFARAKMFYGEGAGTRRKLIKATVEAKSNKDPSYKKAFDHHLSNQDLSKHASKARGERKRKDTVKSTAKTARGIRHIINGNSQYASLAAALLFGGAMYAHKSGIDKVVFDAGKNKLSDIKFQYDNRNGMPVDEFLRNLGIDPN